MRPIEPKKRGQKICEALQVNLLQLRDQHVTHIGLKGLNMGVIGAREGHRRIFIRQKVEDDPGEECAEQYGRAGVVAAVDITHVSKNSNSGRIELVLTLQDNRSERGY